MANTVRILVTAKDEVSGPLDKIRDKASLLSKTDIGKGLLQGIGQGVWGSIANAAADALGKVTDFFAGSIAAAQTEEISIAKLTTSLKANTAEQGNQLGVVEKVISAREKLAFSDDEQRASLAVLIARTKDSTKALELNRLAMDVARLKGIDLATASELVGKVYGGNIGILSRYGIAVEKGASATEALASLQKAAAGQAEAFADTTAGSMQGAQIAIDDLQETIGQELLPVVKDVSQWVRDEGVPALAELVDILKQAGTHAEEFGVGFDIIMNGGRDTARKFAEQQERTNQAIADSKAIIESVGAKSWDTYSEAAMGAHAAIGKVDDASTDTRPHVKGLGGAAQKAADEFADLRKNVDDAAQAIAEAAYGPEELRLEFAKNRMELQDNQAELKRTGDRIEDLEKKGKPVPRHLREEFLDLELAVNGSKDEITQTGIKLLGVGGIKMNALEKEFSDLGVDLSGLTGDAATLWRLLHRIEGVKISSQDWGNWNNHGHAAGGYIAPYSGSMVNEGVNGAEGFMRTGSQGVYVNPSASAASAGALGGGSPVVIQLMADRRVLAELVAPGVTAWQQQSNILPRR